MLHFNDLWTDQKMEAALGSILRIGVFLAATFVLVGGIIYLSGYGLADPQYWIYRGEPSDLKSMSGIVDNALHLQGRGLIQIGLLILIATPVARVALSAFAFARQHDFIYVVVSLIVLALLIFSLAGGAL
jgi:uncharacterized membrane protein